MNLTKGKEALQAMLIEARKQAGNMTQSAFAELLTEKCEQKYPRLKIQVKEGSWGTFEGKRWESMVNLNNVIALVEAGVVPGLDYNLLFEIIKGHAQPPNLGGAKTGSKGRRGGLSRSTSVEPSQHDSLGESRHLGAVEKIRKAMGRQVGKPLTDTDLLSVLRAQAGISTRRLQAIIDGHRPDLADLVAIAKAARISSKELLAAYGFQDREKNSPRNGAKKAVSR